MSIHEVPYMNLL